MAMLDQDIIREATRLTRAGQLMEATALLQRMLRGEHAQQAPTPARPALRQPVIIDVQANPARDTADPPRQERASSGPTTTSPFRRSMADRPGGRKRGARPSPPPTPDLVPDGARFIHGTHRGPRDSRDYRLFIPSGYRDRPLPLVVMLHGCTQSPEDFAAGTRMNLVAEEHNCLVVYPAQPGHANRARCWNWFRAGDQQRDAGEPALIAGITRQVMGDFAVDPRRVYVGGLSAGAAAAAVMGATYDDLYAALGIHSGLACGAATDLPSALLAMQQGGAGHRVLSGERRPVPAIVFHGDRDTTVHPSNGDAILTQCMRSTSLQQEVQRGQIAGGHGYTRTILSDADGVALLEHWTIHGAGHAWSGGSPAGSYTDPQGPDATREMLRFFLAHSLPGT